MSSGAERQRRLRERRRLHDRGDHSKCVPGGQCDVLPAPPAGGGDVRGGVTGDVTPALKNPVPHRDPPADLKERGQALWEQMAGLKLDPTHVLLLEQTCRKADRLEEMNQQLRGRGWVHLVETPDGGSVEVKVDKLLSEIRLTEIALKLDVAELRNARRPASSSAPSRQEADEDDDDAADEAGARPAGNVTSISAIINRPARG